MDSTLAVMSVIEKISFQIINLTIKAPITTAPDENKNATFFSIFEKNKSMIFHENRLPADDSHEISCLVCYF